MRAKMLKVCYKTNQNMKGCRRFITWIRNEDFIEQVRIRKDEELWKNHEQN